MDQRQEGCVVVADADDGAADDDGRLLLLLQHSMAAKGKMPLCEEATLVRGEAVADDDDGYYHSNVVEWGSPVDYNCWLADSPLLARLAVRNRRSTTIRNVTWKTTTTTTTHTMSVP